MAHEARSADRADVLVIGGGPAGCWAAIAAASAAAAEATRPATPTASAGEAGRGASVILVDKGFCGTSGATAPSGTGVWWVPPGTQSREQAKAQRLALGGHLAHDRWMDRVLDQSWANLQQLADWGYPFPVDAQGQEQRGSLQGPEYMRLLRRRVKAAGVRILDHHPALELLRDDDGAVVGAAGVIEPDRGRWAIEAGAVVLATGGCAFLGKALGTNLLTGDGHLMAAEVGAALSGMEFSNAYGLGPAFSSVTKSLFYNWATFREANGTELAGAGSSRGRSIIAKALIERPVYAILDRADREVRDWMRGAQPNFFLPFDRLGIDPFTTPFPITLRLEGTVRGTGGIELRDEACATRVPGLYAAGDVATRELICGGFTGGGSHNAAWALSSGFWAGAGAAGHAAIRRGRPQRTREHAGTVGLAKAGGGQAPLPAASVIAAVQAEVWPLERNWFRSDSGLRASLQRLDVLWSRLRESVPAEQASPRRTREAVAMTAVARWMYRSALARTETRGMHRRDDHPALDPEQRHHVLSGGLDHVWTETVGVPPERPVEQASAATVPSAATVRSAATVPDAADLVTT